MSCYSCGSGYHEECINQDASGKCCCILSNDSSAPVAEDEEDSGDFRKKKLRSRGKRDATLKDQQSTGRKRAAQLFPLDREADCEWKSRKFAGGGIQPIIGCINGKQEARHHGPDKNTLNNEVGNVHRICAKCHNRWHTRNDDGYEWASSYSQHDENTLASAEELVANEFEWLSKKIKVVKHD